MTRELQELTGEIEICRGADPRGVAKRLLNIATTYEVMLEAIYDNPMVLSQVCGQLPEVYTALRSLFGDK